MPADLFDNLSSLSTVVIGGLFVTHVLTFFVLRLWAGRDRRRIASVLFDFTRGLKNRSLLSNVSAADQTDAFLADIGDVLRTANAEDRASLAGRVTVLDERRDYLRSGALPTCYNVARTMVEAYPLLGVLGTILAIAAVQSQPDAGVQEIVGRFGEAISSTAAGLIAGIVLMFLNGILEPGFERLAETRQVVRDTIAAAKRELLLNPAGGDRS